jgi:DNA-binding SARP family transcriptional activator
VTPLVRLRLLGPLELTVAGTPMPVGGPGRRAVLTMLGLERGSVVAVGLLLEAVWDDRAPVTATTKLQGHVSALRHDLVRLGGPDALHVVQTKPPGYVLCAHRTVTDVGEFDTLVRRAAESGDPVRRMQLLSAALDLWRGEACAGASSARLAAAAARLEERRWRAMEDCAEARLELGDHGAVVDEMGWLVHRSPYRERAWEHLIRAHLGRGDLPAALAAHDELSRVLAADLGVLPGPRIRRLVETVREARSIAGR